MTYPCYSPLQITQTVSCIEGVLIYRKRQIFVDETEVDKWSARAAEVKRILAKAYKKEALQRSLTDSQLSPSKSNILMLRDK